MSKYKLESGEEIEMNDLVEIFYNGGWNGGCYNINVKECMTKRFFILTELGVMELPTPSWVTIGGTDYDHGHNYSWSRDDLQFKHKTPYGFDATVTLYDLVQKHKLKVWML